MRARSDEDALKVAWAVRSVATPAALRAVTSMALGWTRRQRHNAQRKAIRAGLVTFDHDGGVWRVTEGIEVARCAKCGKFSLVGRGKGHNRRGNGRPQSYCVACAGEAVKRHRESLR